MTVINNPTDPDVHHVYDSIGNRIERADVTGNTYTMYDPLNRITAEDFPGTADTAYTYDPAGNLLSLTDVAGTVTYGYNDANQVISVTEPGNVTTTLSYTSNGQSDVTGLPNGWMIDRDYDSAGRLSDLVASDGTTTEVDRWHNYDRGGVDSGLITQIRNDLTATTDTYYYDALERLSSVWAGSTNTHSYAYDPAGNMTSRADPSGTVGFTYDAANQLTGIGSATVSHDGQGNQTGTSTGDTYTYDELNRPTSITAGGTTRTATYAGADSVDRPALGSTSYTTSLLGVTAQTTGTTTIGYTRLPTGEVLSRRDGTTRHYMLPDHQGSTLALVDHSGAVTTRYTYSPYGQTTTTSLGTGHIDQPYRYTGQHQDPTGLYKMGLRYYNPAHARWTQPDPALPISQLPFGNTYLYVGGNPLNGFDPTGAFDAYGFVRDAGTNLLIGIVCGAAGAATSPVGGVACGIGLGTATSALYATV